MRDAGLVQVGRYVVPLGNPAVVRHFVGHHLVAHDLRERLCGWLARGAVALGLPPLAGRALHAGYRPRSADAPWCGPARAEIAQILRELGIGDEGLHMHVLDPGAGAGPSRGGLVFGFDERGGSAPVVVLKIRPRSGERPGLAGEWRALHDLRERLPDRLRDTLPEPLAHHTGRAVEIVAMTCLPGRPAYLELHNRLAPAGEAPHHLAAAVSWLAALHEATGTPGGEAEDGSGLPDPRELPAAPPPRAARPAGTRDLAWYEELREELARTPLVLTPSHGDYWARNLLLEGRRVRGVVDWEHYRDRALPTADLFHLLISYGLALRWTRFRRTPLRVAFRRTFVDRNRVSRGVRAALTMYAHARSTTLARLERLFLLHLLTRGARGGARGGPPEPDPFPAEADWGFAYRIMRSSPRSVFAS